MNQSDEHSSSSFFLLSLQPLKQWVTLSGLPQHISSVSEEEEEEEEFFLISP